MTSPYPTNFDTDSTLYVAANLRSTVLTQATSSDDTSVTVLSTLGYPTSGIVRLGEPNDPNVEFRSYSSLTGTTLNGMTPGFDLLYPPAPHTNGTTVTLVIAAQHHNALASAEKAVQATLGLNPQGGSSTVADRLSEGEAALTNHESDSDPHPQYLTGAEGDVRYQLSSALTETVQDIVGGMVSGNSVDGTSASYNDLGGKLDLTNTDKGSVAIVSHIADSDPHTQYQKESERGAVGGYASLDSFGKVPSTQLPPPITFNVEVVPDIAARNALTPSEGDIALVQDSDGFGNPASYIWDGSMWAQISSGSGVATVNGLTGVVNLSTSEIPEGVNKYYTDELAQDAAASMIVSGTHVGVTPLYSDTSNALSLSLNVPSLSTKAIPAAGDFIPIYDASGASHKKFNWTSLPSGDNLGNHTQTQSLNANNFRHLNLPPPIADTDADTRKHAREKDFQESGSILIPCAGISESNHTDSYDFTKISSNFPTISTSHVRAWLADPDGEPWIDVQLGFGVMMGDSVARGTDGSTISGRLDPTLNLANPNTPGEPSYEMSQLTGAFWYNHGWGGQETGEIFARWPRDVLGQNFNPGDGRGSVTLPKKADFVYVSAGANDIGAGRSAQYIIDGLTNMAKSAMDNGIRFIYHGMLAGNSSNPIFQPVVDELNARIPVELPAYGAIVLPYKSWAESPPGTVLTEWIPDGTHPSRAGNQAWFRFAHRYLEAMPIHAVGFMLESPLDPSSDLNDYGRPRTIQVAIGTVSRTFLLPDEECVVIQMSGTHEGSVARFTIVDHYGGGEVGKTGWASIQQVFAPASKERFNALSAETTGSQPDISSEVSGAGAPDTAPDSATVPHVAVVQGSNPTIVTSPWSGFGNAFQFSGNNYLDAGTAITTLSPSFTLEYKFKGFTSPSGNKLAGVGILSPDNTNIFLFLGVNTDGRAVSYVIDDATGAPAVIASDTLHEFDDGSQHTISCGWSVTDGVFKMQVDGVARSSRIVTTIRAPTSDAPFTIARSSGDIPSPGVTWGPIIIDEVHWSNARRHSGNYTVQTSPFTADANTIGLWHLNSLTSGATTQSIPNNTWTTIAYAQEAYDTNSMHSNTLNPSRVTAKQSGKYSYSGHVTLASSAGAGARGIRIRKNGSNVLLSDVRNAVTGQSQELTISGVERMDSGDFLEVMTFQDSGLSLNATGGKFTVIKVA